MASDSNTLKGGHDSIDEYPCSLCEKEGKQIGATQFCKECFVFMCDSCVQRKHDAFPLNKRHKMIDHSQFSTMKESSLRSFPTTRCPKHPGELINIYCGEHDVVCCLVCKALEHSNCAKSQHLLDAAKGINIKSKECQNIIRETETFLNDMEKVLNAGKEEIVRIAEAKQQVKKIIADFRKRAIRYFNDLEKKSLDELQALESKIISKTEQGVKDLEASRTGMEEILQQLQSFKGDNECEIFVHIKDGKRLLSGAKESFLRVSRSVKKESIYYEVDPKIEEFLKSLKTFGSFTNKPVSITRQPVKPADTGTKGVQQLKFETYQATPLLLCASHGYILILLNTQLTRYNESYQRVDSVAIPGKPICICDASEASGGQVVVLYEQEVKKFMIPTFTTEYNDPTDVGSVARGKVGFITVGNSMLMNRVFSVEHNATGMVYCDGKIFVCCKEDQTNPYEEREGSYGKGRDCNLKIVYSNINGEGCPVSRIAVYSECGQLQRYIPQSPQYFPFELGRLTASYDGQYLLAMDSSSSALTKLDLCGNVVDRLRGVNATEVSTDGTGRVFAFAGKQVFELSLEQQEKKVIVGQKDGLNYLTAMCFDKKNQRLLVISREHVTEQNFTKHIDTMHTFKLD